MNGTRSTGVARRLALAATLLVSVGSTAQASINIPAPTVLQATVFTPGLPGQLMMVFVSVLGGASHSPSQLAFYQNGVSNPGVNIGPAGTGTNPWVAAPNSTFIGTFLAGTELIFGDQFVLGVGPGVVFSGNPARNPRGKIDLNNWGTSVVFEDDGVTPFPGTPALATTYGFEEEFRNGGGDYNDLLFTVTARAVAPEPASMVLLGSGIVGMMGAGVIRRRRKA